MSDSDKGAGRNQREMKTWGTHPLFLALAIVNTVAILFISISVFVYKGKNDNGWGDSQFVEGLPGDDGHMNEETKRVGKLIPLDTFLVNLAGSRGRKLVKLNMELEIQGEDIQEEMDRLRPKIRDIIIILLSSKSYEDISDRKGKEELRDEIRDQVNLFLTKGRIRSVYFTQLIFS